MAVRLGDYKGNKMAVILKNSITYDVKINTIKVLVGNMDGLVQLANDIYDTYLYIRKDDNEFAKQLWNLLCRNRVNGIGINSYWAWGAKIGSHVHLSIYGVSIYHQSIAKELIDHFGCDEKDLYRGKALLLDYLDNYYVKDEILDKIIEELKVFIASFEKYANDFFDSVSAYNVKKIG